MPTTASQSANTNSMRNSDITSYIIGSYSNEKSTQPLSSFAAIASKMRSAGLPSPLIALFGSYYDEIAHNKTGLISEQDIEPLSAEDIPCIRSLSHYEAAGHKALPSAVSIKLNGGLGTSMGMTFAKSLVPVRNGLSFLEIIVRQAVHSMQNHSGDNKERHLPLAFMNSFSTHTQTLEKLEQIGTDAQPACFTQHKFPKIHRVTHAAAEFPKNPEMEWSPPGHGDIYAALTLSGVLDSLISQGKRYAFISNSDNLGATLDPCLLGYVSDNNIPFLMEVAPRTSSDKKGGHLARRKGNGLILRELAQCPESDLEAFQNIERYGLFNTNNIWIDLHALKEHVSTHGLLKLPMILNPKTTDPNDESTPPVYQVESAMGSAISCFPGAQAIVTARERFIPVKKCSDLLAVMSDCYLLRDDFVVSPNPARTLPPISIDLDSKHYKTVQQLNKRFPDGPPSLVQCSSLSIKGAVTFGKNVKIIGNVTITNTTQEEQYISSGTVISRDMLL